MGETGFTCLKIFAKLQSYRLTTKQGSSTPHTFLPGMYASLVSHIFDFGLWPMQGIRPRHGHFDLSRNNGKTGWNAFELGFAVWNFVTLKRKKRAGDFSRPSGDFSRLKGDFTRPTCFIHYLRLGPSMFQLKPIQGQFQSCLCQSKLLRLQQAGVWQLRIGTWNSFGKFYWDSLAKPRNALG